MIWLFWIIVVVYALLGIVAAAQWWHRRNLPDHVLFPELRNREDDDGRL